MVNAYLTYNTLCFDIVPVISQELIYPLIGRNVEASLLSEPLITLIK
jgi:hypothetical protein